MGGIEIFCIVRIVQFMFLAPWKFIIGASLWEAIVAHGKDLVILLTMHAPTWVLGSLERLPERVATPIKYSSHVI